MPLLRTGRDRVAGLISGDASCHWGTSGASLWVAASTVAFDAASTWPVGSGAATTQAAGYPITAANVLQYRGVWATDQGNHAWDNWWLNTATASGAGVPLNWATTQGLGTKPSNQTWQLTVCMTVTT